MKVLKCGIVGCGGIAQVHGAVLDGLETAELVAFADCEIDKAQKMAEQYGGNAYNSLEAMLEKQKLDVLHICTPHYLHTPMAKLAAEKGIHVFTEKPPVISWEQWEEFQRLQEKVRVGICFQNNYNPSVRLLKEIVDSGKTGKILGARAFVTWRREAPYYTESGWRGRLETEGGGALINQSIHTMHLLGLFLGRAKSVEASCQNHHLKGVIEVEDTLEAYINFDGANALFYASTAFCTDSPVLVELVCENATLRMEEQEVGILWKDGTREHRSLAVPVSPGTGKAYWGHSHGLCIADFYSCVLESKPFHNDIEGVKNTIDLMLSVYDSARGAGVVKLAEKEHGK